MVIIGTNRRRKRPPEWLPIHTSAPWHQNSFESIPCVKCGVANEMCFKKKLEMFLRGILRDFVEPFKPTVQFRSWPKLGGVIRDHFFGVFSSWLPGMGGSKGQPWKLVSCCGFAQKVFLGKFFFSPNVLEKNGFTSWRVWDCVFLFQKVGGWTKKTLASKAMKTIGYSKVIHSAPKLVLGCPSRR